MVVLVDLAESKLSSMKLVDAVEAGLITSLRSEFTVLSELSASFVISESLITRIPPIVCLLWPAYNIS
jgi:hypothetical protein